MLGKYKDAFDDRILENKLEHWRTRDQEVGSVQNYRLVTHLKMFSIKLSLNTASSTTYNDLLIQRHSGRFYFLEIKFIITNIS